MNTLKRLGKVVLLSALLFFGPFAALEILGVFVDYEIEETEDR